jgi:predicted AlkP superfamily pyrophosphatase or phosphodiesterase
VIQLRALVLVALTALATVVAGVGAAPARHLVIVSIDALRPEFYLDAGYPAPALRALVAAGSHARAATAVFPSVTYPGHAAIVTGVRPARHGIIFNTIWTATGTSGRWYEEAADLRAPPLWDVARRAGLTTAAVSWPSTLGARIDWLVPERDYYRRSEPLELLRQATTPGLFERLGVTPPPGMFKNIVEWDEFLTATARAIVQGMRPNLLLLHLVQLDYYQHRGGRDAAELRPALARVDGHISAIVAALREAGIAGDTTVIVTGDHGFQDVRRIVHINEILARAGLGGCPSVHAGWRAAAHVTGGSAGIFVRSAADGEAASLAEAALRRDAQDRDTLIPRRQLDELGAMPGAAFAVEASPGYAFGGACGEGIEAAGHGGTHGFLPSRASMSTGFIAAGAGVRAGVALERVALVDVAPTAARLLGLELPPVEGRVLQEVLR